MDTKVKSETISNGRTAADQIKGSSPNSVSLEAWVKPTLERLSLRDALGGGETTTDGPGTSS